MRSTYIPFPRPIAWRVPSFNEGQRDGLHTDKTLILERFLFGSLT